MSGSNSVVRRLLAALLAILIALPLSIAGPFTGPAAAAVRAAPAAPAAPASPSKGGNDQRGKKFYDTARGKVVKDQAIKDGKWGNLKPNPAGVWAVGSAPPGKEQMHNSLLQQAWSVGEERNLKLSYISASQLKEQNPALYNELKELMDFADSDYILQAVGVNSPQGNTYGDRNVHTEGLLLTALALDKYVGMALQQGMAPQDIVNGWKNFINGLPRPRNAYRDKLMDKNLTINGIRVGGVELPDTAATENQPCGSKSDAGCSVIAKNGAAWATKYAETYDIQIAAAQDGLVRMQVTAGDLSQHLAAGNVAQAQADISLLTQITNGLVQSVSDGQKKVNSAKSNTKASREMVLKGRQAAAFKASKVLQNVYKRAMINGNADLAKSAYTSLTKLDKNAPTQEKLNGDAKKAKQRADQIGKTLQAPVPCPPATPGALGTRTGQPVRAQVAALPAAPCPGEKSAAKSAPTGLQQSIEAADTGQNGGIDFSSLDLRYMADKPSGNNTSSIQYAFSGKSTDGDPHTDQGAKNLKQASDAFFTWLALPKSADWVNLNPNEPDRIIDSKMGQTDAGRVMLQGDLGLKNGDGKWLDPRSSTGKKFWDGLQGKCFSFRMWIVPGTADVYDGGDELYIEKAPLKVMMEAQYLKTKGINNLSDCKADQSADDHNEALYRKLILPKVTHMVNTDKSYAELRRVYRSRIAAEWYRRRSVQHDTAYKPIIDSGDISKWKYTGSWTPQQTFEKYKAALGSHKVTLKSQRGNYIYKTTYTFGGVDWTNLPYTSQARAAFQKANPALGANVGKSLNGPVADGGQLLLGGAVPVAHATATTPAQAPSMLVGMLILFCTPVVLVAGGLGLGFTLTRRKRRPSTPNGVR